MTRTDRATLDLGQRFGQGGQGTVHEVRNRRINGQWDVAYKEYEPEVLDSLDVSALGAMADLVGQLPGWDAAWLCDKTAWPAELVESGGSVTGFLMRAVPQRFAFDLRTLSGTTRKLATMEFLLNDDAYVGQIGLQVSDRDRLLVLADLADTLARLHAMEIVVGDLSPKNLLFTTGASPECFLIDCDAMRLRGVEALPQVETPDWQIPLDEPKGTPQGDAYKFALLAVRVFARDQSSTDPGRLAAISPGLADLAAGALSRPPADRPDPAQWAVRLRDAVPAASTVPTLPPPVVAPPVVSPAGVGPGGVAPSRAPSGGLSNGAKVGLGVGVGAVGLALVAAVALMGTRALVNAGSVAASSTPTPTPTPSDTYTYTPTPTPSDTYSSETPTVDTFDPSDLDSKSSDTTPLTASAMLPDSFTSAKNVQYNYKAGGVNSCPAYYHDGNIKSALRKASCTKMVTGAFVNPAKSKNRRIMVSVWVVPLKNSDRADSAYSRIKNAYADDWGILCPRKGPGAGLCDTTSWNYAQTYGWTGYKHRYLIHTMAIYTNRTRDASAKTWLKDASKAAYKAVGPMVYHNGD